MKKLLLTCAAGVLAASVYGQGLVTINDTTVNISTNGVTSGVMNRTANSYFFTLLTVADLNGSTTVPTVTAASLSSWLTTGVNGTNATTLPLAGKILATGVIPGASAANTVADTQTNFFVVVGWSANLSSGSSSWASIASQATSGNWLNSGYFGISSVGYGVPSSISPGWSFFGSNPGQVTQGFVLNAVTAVPEPGTLALAAIGGASLLLFRRRK